MVDSNIGQSVRTLEGHAAMAMKRNGPDDLRWIEIQNTTFKNWVNEQLRGESPVSDLETELANGIKLIALVEALQSKPIGRKYCKNPQNHHQYLENLSIALDAIRKDKVKLVNIGSEDIVEGNLKLILGLIWHLILRYQIGKTTFPPKKMMLIWLQYALPKCSIKNFSSSWNDGVALHALIEFCHPGTCPEWEKLDRSKKLDNCKDAMNIAKDKFDIPLVVRPEDLASPHLDELSGMTYLSYYMKQDSPGYKATLNRVKNLLQRNDIHNFTTDWNDGQLVCELVNTAGGNITNTNGTYEEVLTKGLNAGKLMSIQPTISAKEMAQEKEEHLGIMAYAVKYLDKVPTVPESEKVTLSAQLDKVHVGNETKCKVSILNQSASSKDVKVEVSGPNSKLPVQMNWSGQTAEVKFTPTEVGKHKLIAYNGENVINGCPKVFNVISDRSKVSYDQFQNCCYGTVTEIKVNAVSAGQGKLKVSAKSPSGEINYPSISSNKGMHTANFIPTEVGDWNISVLYDEDHISGSPFTVNVFDASQVEIYGLEGGTVGKELSFKADCSRAGKGDFECSILHDRHDVPLHATSIGNAKHEVTFVPQGAGLYKIQGLFNNVEIKGSPYTLEIVDSNMVSVSGAGLELVSVNKTTSFNILTKGAGGGEVKVNITSPLKLRVVISLKQPQKGIHVAEFTPKQTGDYIVHVTNQGGHVKGSPFMCKAYDTGKVKVTNMPVVSAPDKLIEFGIDVSQAGQGNLDIEVNGKRIACNIKNLGNQHFAASFKPENKDVQVVGISFNKEPVRGSPWKIGIIKPANFTIQEPSNKLLHINEPGRCTILGPNPYLSDVEIKVHDSKMSVVRHNIINETENSRTVEFTPVTVGVHKVDFTYNGEKLKDCPQNFKSYDPSAIVLSEMPKLAAVGKKEEFTIDVSKSGDGRLKIKLNKGELQNKVINMSHNYYGISFVPQKAGPVEIDLTFNDRPIKDSPYICNVVDASQIEVLDLANFVRCDTLSTFKLHPISNLNTNKDIEVTATSPSDKNILCHLTGSPQLGFQVEYIPTEVGIHEISVTFSGTPIKNSPFQVKCYDSSLVKVSEIPQGIVGVPCKFIVDTSSAGEGNLQVDVYGGAKPVPYHMNYLTSSRYEVTILAQLAIRHQVHLKFNSDRVPGSPYIIDYLDTADISASGDGLGMVCCQQSALFTVDAKGASLSDLNIEITAPDGKERPVKLKNKGDHMYQAEWTPVVVGDHKIEVAYANTPIKNSPFTAKAYDASKVTVNPATKGNLGKPVEFILDANKAGIGNIEIFVTVNGENVPNYVKQETKDCFKISFTPQEPFKHMVHIKFNGDPVKGSPFQVRILNSDRIHVSGEALQLASANTLSSFKIDPKGAGEGEVNVSISGPSGKQVPARVSGSSASVYRVDFTPSEIGKHTIKVAYDDVEIKGSPFYCNVFDANLSVVKGSSRAYMNRNVTILVDTSPSGVGHLEAEVKCKGSLVRSNVQDVGSGKYEVTYTPREASTHMVTLLFNGYPLPGSPLHTDILDSSSVSASGEGLKRAQVFRSTGFDINANGGQEDLNVTITSPTRTQLPFNKVQRGSACHIDFSPREVGTYTIEALIAGNPISGSPYYCQAFDPNLVRITDVDRNGKVQREIYYAVDASAAGNGDLETAVTHYGRTIRTKRENLPDSNYRFSFVPEESGQYEVDVQFNNEKIPGCPVIVMVEDEMPTFITINFRGIQLINAMDLNWFLIELNGEKIDMSQLQILIRAPNGESMQAKIIPQHDGDYKVEWTPTVAGRYSIDILYSNKQIDGSPFTVDVFDIKRIRVEELYSTVVDEPARFTVDFSEAGRAEHSITIVDPTGKTIPFELKEKNAKNEISYVPRTSGNHNIFINYGGIEVPGTPIIQEVGIGALPTAHGEGLHGGDKDKPATFYVDYSGLKGDLFVQVDGPNSIAKCNIHPEINGTYTVTYIPVETGFYHVIVKWNGRQIPGSPFQPKIVDARKVHVVGGWQHFMDSNDRVHLVVNDEKRIPFDISEAGPGKLTAEVKDPRNAKIPVHIDTSSDGKNILVFTPRIEGDHHIDVYWCDHPLVGAPFLGHAVSKQVAHVPDASKIVLAGKGLKEAIVREEAEFRIDGSKAGPGKPEVNLTGVHTDIDVEVIPQGNGCYRCKYMPIIPGAYLLNITWNDRQLKGSPYKISIIAAPQPQQVMVTGDGLQGGIIGKDLQMHIDTRKAGLGELTAHCLGPSRIAYCELIDNHDGIYKLTVRPQEAGRHVLQIKFGGEHVLGSPYVLKIGSLPDASKVRVSGPGVEHGILATYQSKFLVETRGAGAGQLSVRIKGPKGAFQVEMYRDNQKDRNIICCYNPYETGLYVIQVKWSGGDVPGSPFQVHIVDTQQEYESIVQETGSFHHNGYAYPESSSQRLPYSQWRDDI